jgi:predicted permease
MLLPERDRDVMLGDLDEEFARHVMPTRGRVRARAWYWRQVIRSMPAVVRLRRSHQTADRSSVRPTGLAGLAAGLAADLRFGIRLARRRPALAAAVVTTLAIGVAVTTAVMSLANAILLRPLPYADPGALVVIREIDTRRERSSGNVSWPDFLDYQSRAGTFSSIAGFSGGTRALTGAGSADRVSVVEVTPNFLATLGVRPTLGRDLLDEDAVDGAPGVVVLTDRTWRARFGASPDIVGRAIDLGGAPTTVVGVLPPDFTFPLRGLAEMFVPAQLSAAQVERRYFHWLDAVGRMAPGVTPADAERDLARVAAGFALIDPEYHPAASVAVLRIADAIVGDVRPMLLALAGAGVLLGLITAINIAGLLVARASTRDREVSVRAAIGATRGRIVRQLVVESLVLAVPATAIGLGAGVAIVRLFVGLLPEAQRAALPQLQDLGLGLDVSLAGALVAIVAALLCGLVPAWRLLGRNDVLLRAGVGGDRRHGRLSSGLVLAQVGIAVLLLTCAGLMGQSVRRLSAVSPGFDPDGLLTMRLSVPGAGYPGAESVLAFHGQLLEAIEAVPGVTGVATVNQLPLTGQGGTGTFRVDGEAVDFHQSTRVRTVTANYFDVLGIPMRDGRAFAGGDRPGAPPVVLVNESFARLVFEGRAVGRGISFPFVDG